MANKLKIKLWISTNKVGSECKSTVPLIDYGITDAEWNAKTEDEQSALLDEWALEYMNNTGEMGAAVE